MRQQRLASDLALLLCAWAAAWPLTELIHGTSLTISIALIVAALVAFGAICRIRPLPGILILTGQCIVMLTLVAVALALRGISPAPTNVSNLVTDVDHTVRTWTAPLPATAGVSAMILLAAAFIGLAVDYVGGTARMPLFAAVPVIAPFVLSAAAIGHILPARFFIAAASAWALVVLTGSDKPLPRLPHSWMTMLVTTVMVASAIVVAILTAGHIPHRPEPQLGQRNGGGVDASVDFSRSLDLRKSLHSTNSAPVLQYDTTATDPAPLRVTTSSSYADGVWKANSLDEPFTDAKAQTALVVPGLDSRTPTISTHTSVTINGMKPPLVAAPVPLHAANFGSANGSFRVVTASGVPLVSHKTNAYAVLSYDFPAQARPTSNAPTGTMAAGVTSADLDVSQLPSETLTRVRNLAQQSAGNAQSPFDKAVAIQQYLRFRGGFTYSLTAPSAQVGNDDPDPLAAFLTTKKGYCTQFATTMIMAARADGIPARIAIGFLPGKKKSGHYQVRAADAHAWPELYFPGMGWTRFDPTPPGRSGAAPAYAPDASRRAQRHPTPSSTPRSSAPSQTPSPVSHHAKAHHSTLWPKVLRDLALLALIAALAAVLPLAGRRERERYIREATTDAELNEGHWYAMRWQLADLGIAVAPGHDPATTLKRFQAENTRISEMVGAAFEHAIEAIEGARYAPPPAPNVENATRRVVVAANDEASSLTKLRAFLVPASGVEFFRRLMSKS